MGGRLTVEGDVTACGASSTGYYTGAGGSVWLTCGTLAGGGAVKANGGNGPSGILGSGGRVAVYQRTAADWSAFEGLVQAYGGSTGTSYSGPGTVYKVTAAEADDEGVLEIRSPVPSYNGVVQINTKVTDTRIGTLDLPAGETLRILSGGTLTVTRDWLNRGTFTADDGSTVVFAGTNTSHVFGKNTFSALACAEPGKRLVFAGGKTNWCDVAANGRLTLRGTAEKPVELLTEPGDATIRMTIAAGVKQDVTHAALSNVVSSAGMQGVAYDSTDLGGNLNWLFTASIVPGTTNTWTGAASAAWFEAGNWSLGRVPVATDVARIAAAGTPPVVGYDLEINSIAIDAGATLTVSGAKVTVTNRLDATGTLAFAGTETLTLAGDARFAGAQSLRGNGTLLVSGARPHRFEGLGTAFYVVTVGAESGDVTFAGGFSALTLNVAQGASARTLSFEAGKSFAFEELYAYGVVDGEPSLVMTGTDGGAWSLAVSAFAKLEGVRACNCDASAGTTIYADRPSEDLGGNANWVFNGETAEWTGGAGTTVFGTAANWSTFAVPGKSTRVVIAPSAASTVELKSSAKVGELCLDGGKGALTFKTGTFRLEVTGSLTVKRGATAYLDVPCAVGGDVFVRAGGKVTHSGGSQTAWSEPTKIDLTAGGDVQVDADGAINASQCGYGTDRGPGAAGWASHGGRMYDNLYWGNGTACYGSITCPTNYGTGGHTVLGGGAIKVTAAGDMRVNGRIIAQGGPSSAHYSGTGGSVWLTCATLTGAGEISANGGDGTPCVGAGGDAGADVARGRGDGGHGHGFVVRADSGSHCGR